MRFKKHKKIEITFSPTNILVVDHGGSPLMTTPQIEPFGPPLPPLRGHNDFKNLKNLEMA